MAGASEQLHPPPGVPPVAGYVYVPGSGLWQAGGGVDQGDGSVAVSTADHLTDTRYEWQLSGTASVPLYVGTAPPGSATSAAVWRIERYTFIAGPGGEPVPSVILAAVGAWDDRTTLLP